jgi:Tfp pilus assembly protein PilX
MKAKSTKEKYCFTYKNNANRGFVLLFSVTVSSILLAIALGVANIALKEIKFSTSIKDSNNALFAADTAIEYTLYNDRSDFNSYPPTPGAVRSWSFVVSGLGYSGASCAKVTITKDNTNTLILPYTTIVAKGYNIGNASCNSTSGDRIERELEVSY